MVISLQKMWILHLERKVSCKREEAHEIDPVHELHKVLAPLDLELLYLKPEQQKRSEHANTQACHNGWLKIAVLLHHKW